MVHISASDFTCSSGVLVVVGLLALGCVERGPLPGRMTFRGVFVGADAGEGLGADALARARRRMVGDEVAGEEVEGVVVVGLAFEEVPCRITLRG